MFIETLYQVLFLLDEFYVGDSEYFSGEYRKKLKYTNKKNSWVETTKI